MSGKRREPDPTRLCMTTGDAARILKCLPITVRRRVERGELQGGQKRSGRWYVYADQVYAGPAAAALRDHTTKSSPPSDERLARENAELRAQIAELRAQRAEERARSAEAQNTQIVAALHVMNEVLGEFHAGSELAQKSNAHFQAGSATLSKVVSALLDTVAITNTPATPEGI
jgi:hypothetical protein